MRDLCVLYLSEPSERADRDGDATFCRAGLRELCAPLVRPADDERTGQGEDRERGPRVCVPPTAGSATATLVPYTFRYKSRTVLFASRFLSDFFRRSISCARTVFSVRRISINGRSPSETANFFWDRLGSSTRIRVCAQRFFFFFSRFPARSTATFMYKYILVLFVNQRHVCAYSYIRGWVRVAVKVGTVFRLITSTFSVGTESFGSRLF